MSILPAEHRMGRPLDPMFGNDYLIERAIAASGSHNKTGSRR